jgi:hypothetical protein
MTFIVYLLPAYDYCSIFYFVCIQGKAYDKQSVKATTLVSTQAYAMFKSKIWSCRLFLENFFKGKEFLLVV